MSRSAENTIKGFLYQIHKTLLEILRSHDEETVVAEGPIEDIDIIGEGVTRAIQCKYHEAKSTFTLSSIYKPLLQMMDHFYANAESNVQYRLFAYFPNESGQRPLEVDELETILNTRANELQKYTNKLRGQIDLDGFKARFILEFGQSYDDIVIEIQNELARNDMPRESIDTLIYPNAIHMVSSLSIQSPATNRGITKQQLLDKLRKTHQIAISRWTYALQTKRKVLETRKRQVRNKLGQNSQLRCFLISELQTENFVEDIALFICEYLGRYHVKIPHDQTPIFGIDCSENVFYEICEKLHYTYHIRFNDGQIARRFDKQELLRNPMMMGKLPNQRSFRVSLFCFEWDKHLYDSCGNAYVFVVGKNEYDTIDLDKPHIESIAVEDFRELKFILGIADDYQ